MEAEFVKAWLDSFATSEEILSEPAVEEPWLIRGLLRPGTYGIVFGREGGGKSRLLYQLAKSFHDGSPWCGFDVPGRGNVIFVEADMSPTESRSILEDAYEDGFHAPNSIWPTRYGFLDVLTPEGEQILDGLQDRFDPALVVVDTATDVFTPASGDINTPVRDAIRAFRVAFPYAGILFVLHERKASQFLQAKGVEDEDAHLGAGEWPRKASCSLRLKGINETHAKLQVRKTRDVVPFRNLILERTNNGFFTVDTTRLTPEQALAIYPAIEGLVEPEVRTVRGISKAIEAATDGSVKAEAVRKAFQRAKKKKVVFAWEVGTPPESENGLDEA